MDKQSGEKSWHRAGKKFVSGWFPTREVEALDRFHAELQAQNEGITVSRYDALRTLVLAGMKAKGVEVAS